jgi:hypothetical protein
MKTRSVLVFIPAVLLLLWTGHVGGGDKEKDKQPDKDKEPFKQPAKELFKQPPVNPGLVEVRFTNGSVVVMNMLQDKVEIVTEYGKLTVPPKDIRNIEFGLHPTDEESQRLEDALGRLNSKIYKDRESAVSDLIALGPLAYVRLQAAAKSQDPEVARRAESALKTIREKTPAKQLRVREDDLVRTHKFSIVGRIITPTLKARAEDFGDLELRPARLLAIRWLAADTRKEVVVDAGQYGGPGNNKWMPTGIKIEAQTGLKISAGGQVDLLPQQGGQRMVGPDGQSGGAAWGGRNKMMWMNNGGQTGGELLGRIGDNGPIFFVGSRHSSTPKTGGQLFLMISQSPWGCPSAGEYRVTVTQGAFAADEDERDD